MIKQFAAGLLLAATSVTACAADTAGFYLGADFGKTRVDTMSTENSYGIVAGYKINPYLAVEAGYRNMGQYDFVTYYWNPSTRNYYYQTVGVDMKQSSLSVLSSVPLGSRFSLFARVGYNNLSAEVGSVSKNKSGALGGLGAGFAITPNVIARIEYQRPASDVQNLSAGVSYKF